MLFFLLICLQLAWKYLCIPNQLYAKRPSEKNYGRNILIWKKRPTSDQMKLIENPLWIDGYILGYKIVQGETTLDLYGGIRCTLYWLKYPKIVFLYFLSYLRKKYKVITNFNKHISIKWNYTEDRLDEFVVPCCYKLISSIISPFSSECYKATVTVSIVNPHFEVMCNMMMKI